MEEGRRKSGSRGNKCKIVEPASRQPPSGRSEHRAATPPKPVLKVSANKIREPSCSARPLDDAVYVATSPQVSAKPTPRGAALTPRGAALQQAAVPPVGATASSVDIRRELLGSEMRRLIREELRSTLSESFAIGGRDAVSDICGAPRDYPMRASPTEETHHTENESEPIQGHNFRGSAEELLCLRTRTHSLNDVPLSFTNTLLKVGISAVDVEAAADENWWDRHLSNVQRCLHRVGTRAPPPRTDPVSRISDSMCFGVAVHAIIVLNIAFMAFEAEYTIWSLTSHSEVSERIIRSAQGTFVAFYFFEFVVKFARYRMLYFYGKGYGWNWIDFLILVFSLPAVLQIDGMSDALPGKIIRILRLTRAFRVLRMVTVFKKLNTLLVSLTASLSTLACSFTLLVMFLFMFALFFVLRVGQVLGDSGLKVTATQEQELLKSWGSIISGMLTLLACTTGGRDWADEHQILWVTGWGTQAIFVGFVAFSQMALLNIILGMFVEQAQKSMASDKLTRAYQHYKEQEDFTETTRKLLGLVGAEGGKISLEAWNNGSQKQRLYSHLDFNGFQPAEVNKFFELLSETSEDGVVDVDNFVRACVRMKGGASSFPVYEVLLAVSQLDRKLDKVHDKLHNKRAGVRAGNGWRNAAGLDVRANVVAQH